MLNDFFVVSQQVLILFILIAIGLIGTRKGLIDAGSVSGMTNVVLYFVTPCVILNSFQRAASPELIRGLIITAGIALAIHIIAIAVAHIFMRDKDKSKEIIYRFAVVFSNCGFMSLPLQQAVLGDIGVFYGSVFVAVFNVVLWTYGLTIMSGNIRNIKLRNLIFNPGILGTLFGVLIFVLNIHLPEMISVPIGYMAALNTPLPMIIIGYYLSNLHLSDLKDNPKQYAAIALRLVAVPLLAIGFMYIIKVDPTIFTVCTIACCAPTACVTVMFGSRFGRDAGLGAQMVSAATLFSIITIPVMTALAQYISAQ